MPSNKGDNGHQDNQRPEQAAATSNQEIERSPRTDQRKPKDGHSNTNPKPKKGWRLSRAIRPFDILLTLTAVISAVAVSYQSCVLNRTNEIAISQSRELTRSNEIAVNAMKVSNRAYMAPKSATVSLIDPRTRNVVPLDRELRPGDRLDLEINVTNSGQTPALEVRSKVAAIFSVDFPPDDFNNWTANPLQSKGPVANGSSYVVADTPHAPPLTERDIAELTTPLQGDLHPMYLLLVGRLDYKDIFGEAWFLKFCRFYDPRTRILSPCPTHNYMGPVEALNPQ